MSYSANTEIEQQFKRHKQRDTSDYQRQSVKSLSQAGCSTAEICDQLKLSKRQVLYAINGTVESGKIRSGRKPAISDEAAGELVAWLRSNPLHRSLPFRLIPEIAPQLGLGDTKQYAIRSAFQRMGYKRRVAKKKGFSNAKHHREMRLEFANAALNWSRERLYSQVFSDEVWATGGSNSRQHVTVLVDGDKDDITVDRYRPECLNRKLSKLPAWMFHGVLYDGKKALGTFWEKEYGTMNSEQYDKYILSKVEHLFNTERANGRCPVFQHDNAPCHRSDQTSNNLAKRGIPVVSWPPYSPDLNLIEHVWSKMKSYIQERHLRTGYDPQRIGFDRLRQIINDAWESVPDEFITKLYDSWRDRCEAVIRAGGGPTRY